MAGTSPIGAKLGRVDSLPPCGGGLGWGVVPWGTVLLHSSTPTPDPSPAEPRYSEGSATQQSDRSRQQPTSVGGGEEFAASSSLNLAPMGTSPAMTAEAPPRIRKLWLCADDYGISPAVSRAIRDLIGRGRINATSVMVTAPSFSVARDGAFLGLAGTFAAGLQRRLNPDALAVEAENQFAAFRAACGRPPDFV